MVERWHEAEIRFRHFTEKDVGRDVKAVDDVGSYTKDE